jgi:hypothetical protein
VASTGTSKGADLLCQCRALGIRLVAKMASDVGELLFLSVEPGIRSCHFGTPIAMPSLNGNEVGGGFFLYADR